MLGVWCLLLVVCCVLVVVSWPSCCWFVVCCLGRALLFGVGCGLWLLLFVDDWCFLMLFIIVRCPLVFVCRLVFDVCYVCWF